MTTARTFRRLLGKRNVAGFPPIGMPSDNASGKTLDTVGEKRKLPNTIEESAPKRVKLNITNKNSVKAGRDQSVAALLELL